MEKTTSTNKKRHSHQLQSQERSTKLSAHPQMPESCVDKYFSPSIHSDRNQIDDNSRPNFKRAGSFERSVTSKLAKVSDNKDISIRNTKNFVLNKGDTGVNVPLAKNSTSVDELCAAKNRHVQKQQPGKLASCISSSKPKLGKSVKQRISEKHRDQCFIKLGSQGKSYSHLINENHPGSHKNQDRFTGVKEIPTAKVMTNDSAKSITKTNQFKSILEGFDAEIFTLFEESTQKYKLTPTQVKKILKHVLTNENVLAMVQSSMNEEIVSAADIVSVEDLPNTAFLKQCGEKDNIEEISTIQVTNTPLSSKTPNLQKIKSSSPVIPLNHSLEVLASMKDPIAVLHKSTMPETEDKDTDYFSQESNFVSPQKKLCNKLSSGSESTSSSTTYTDDEFVKEGGSVIMSDKPHIARFTDLAEDLTCSEQNTTEYIQRMMKDNSTMAETKNILVNSVEMEKMPSNSSRCTSNYPKNVSKRKKLLDTDKANDFSINKTCSSQSEICNKSKNRKSNEKPVTTNKIDPFVVSTDLTISKNKVDPLIITENKMDSFAEDLTRSKQNTTEYIQKILKDNSTMAETKNTLVNSVEMEKMPSNSSRCTSNYPKNVSKGKKLLDTDKANDFSINKTCSSQSEICNKNKNRKSNEKPVASNKIDPFVVSTDLTISKNKMDPLIITENKLDSFAEDLTRSKQNTTEYIQKILKDNSTMAETKNTLVNSVEMEKMPSNSSRCTSNYPKNVSKEKKLLDTDKANDFSINKTCSSQSEICNKSKNRKSNEKPVATNKIDPFVVSTDLTISKNKMDPLIITENKMDSFAEGLTHSEQNTTEYIQKILKDNSTMAETKNILVNSVEMEKMPSNSSRCTSNYPKNVSKGKKLLDTDKANDFSINKTCSSQSEIGNKSKNRKSNEKPVTTNKIDPFVVSTDLTISKNKMDPLIITENKLDSFAEGLTCSEQNTTEYIQKILKDNSTMAETKNILVNSVEMEKMPSNSSRCTSNYPKNVSKGKKLLDTDKANDFSINKTCSSQSEICNKSKNRKSNEKPVTTNKIDPFVVSTDLTISKNKMDSFEVSTSTKNALEVSTSVTDPLKISKNKTSALEISGNKMDPFEVSTSTTDPFEISKHKTCPFTIPRNKTRPLILSKNKINYFEVSSSTKNSLEVSTSNTDLLKVSTSNTDPSKVSKYKTSPSENSRNKIDSFEVSASITDTLDVSRNKTDNLEILGNKKNPLEVSGNKTAHLEVSRNKTDHLEVSRNKTTPLEISRNKEDPLVVSTQKLSVCSERKWTREQDKQMLSMCKKFGATDKVFEMVANAISTKNAQQVKERFYKLEELFKKVRQEGKL